MIKRLLVMATMFALVTALAACGGGDDDDSGGGSSSGSSPTATTAPAPTKKPSGPSNAELVAIGEKEFGTCAGCHAADGSGVPGLGKNLVGSDFMAGISDDDLATLIKVGRSSSDPENTTGIDMPPKGGNPALNDEKIDGLVAFIRSLQ